MFLTLDTSCNLSENTTIFWFRNRQPVAKPDKFKADAEDCGRYTCTVEGQESVQRHPVFLDVQCEFDNDTNMCYNKFVLLIFRRFCVYNYCSIADTLQYT